MLNPLRRSVAVFAVFLTLSCKDREPTAPPPPVSIDRFLSISAGSQLVCGVGIDSYAYCWGTNQLLALGSRSTETCPDNDLFDTRCALYPQRVDLDVPVSRVFAGLVHACALGADGQAYCWGGNASGQLGRAPTGPPGAPAPVATSVRFTQLVVGWDHTCGLDFNAVVWCWGDNQFGQLGRGTNDTDPHPQVAAIASDLRFQSVALGISGNTCGIATSGGAWCWGENDNELLGNSSGTKCMISVGYGRLCEKTPLRALPDLPFSSVTVGSGHGCGRVASGEWICWGQASTGAHGIGTPQVCVATSDGTEYWRPCNRDRLPVQGGSYAQLHAGTGYTCALNATGQAFCFGQAEPASLGAGSSVESSNVPLPVAGDLAFTALSAGGAIACGLVNEGSAWCWGSTRNGAIGNGSADGWRIDVPTRVLARP